MKLSSFHLALITGASSKLGEHLARELAKQGVSLCLTARDVASLDTLVKELSSLTFTQTLQVDLDKKEDQELILQWIKHHTPDLVINNAGFGFYGDVIHFSTDSQMSILEVNTKAPIAITITAAKALIKAKRSGTIMNISSAADSFAYPLFALYAASKACLTQFSKAFDEELTLEGVRVLTAIPGQIATNFRKHASQNFTSEASDTSMSVQFASLQILKQIEQEKRAHVFSFRYKAFRFFSKLFPEKFLMSILKKTISSRTSPSQRFIED